MNAPVQYPLRIRGAGGMFGTKTPSAPVEAANTLRSRTIADALFMIGEGPIVEPADLYQAVYLNGVPVKSPDGTFNFKNVELTLSRGYPDQVYIPGTPAAESTTGVGVRVQQATPIVRAITDVTATAARVIMTVPALVVADPESGSQGPTSIQIAIDVQPDGGSYAEVINDTVYGKCISAAQKEYLFDLSGTGPWNVRFRRITTDSTSSNLQNETHWYSLSAVRDYRLAYPDSAILRVRIDAEQFSGQFPTVEYQGDQLILEVPSNYDPVARTYSGLWDGTFVSAWTNNPAWVIWAASTNDRWGLGRFIDLAAVDKWALYDLAQWCDELVADGAGGTEPRLTFNGTFDSTLDAYRALASLAGAAQSIMYWSSGAAHVVVDKPVDPVKQLAPANVVGGKFVYEGSDIATRPTTVHVTWRDPDNGYVRAIEPVEDPDLIARHGLRIEEIAAVLCTSQGQAARVGRYKLETEWSEGEILTYVPGEDHHDVMPGDLVDVVDPSIQGRRTGGRLLSLTDVGADLFDYADLFDKVDLFDEVHSASLDQAVVIEPGQSYSLRVPGSDGVLQSRAVVVAPGTTATLPLLSAFSPPPVIGAVWQLIATDLIPRRFRVLAVDDPGDGTYPVTAVLHDPNKLARIEGGLVVSLPDFTAYPTGQIERPTGLVSSERIERLPSGTWRHAVTLGWNTHPDPRVTRFEVEYRPAADTAWTPAGTAIGVITEIDELGDGAYQFRIRALGFDGKVSPWTDAYSATLTGLLAAPPDVAGFAISVLSETAALSWTPLAIANLDHYEVRFAADPTAVLWQSMVPIAQNVVGAFVQLAARSGVYAVKAFTAQGVESVNPALVISSVDGMSINIVETLAGDPNWIGTKENVSVDAARQALRLAPAGDLFDHDDLFDIDDLFDTYFVSPSGTFTWDTPIDLGAVFVSRVSAALDVFGERTTDDVWAEPDLWSLEDIWGRDPKGWDAWIEIRTTEDNPAGTPTWTDWRRLVVSDVKARGIDARFRLSTTDNTVTPIAKGSVIADMPDRVDAAGGISVAVTGTRVSFTKAFNGPVRPAVVITGIEGAASGDWPDVTNVDKTGFDIMVKNGAVGQSGRSIDYHAKGYGAVQ